MLLLFAGSCLVAFFTVYTYRHFIFLYNIHLAFIIFLITYLLQFELPDVGVHIYSLKLWEDTFCI